MDHCYMDTIVSITFIFLLRKFYKLQWNAHFKVYSQLKLEFTRLPEGLME